MSPEQLKHELGAHFTIVRDRSSLDEIVIICPVPGCHDKTGNRSVNVKTLLTHCHRCQDKQPGHVAALFRLLGLDWEDQHVLEPEEIQAILRGGTTEKPLTPIQEVKLPNGFEPLIENRTSCYWRFCREMAERKHLSIEDLEDCGAGFTRSGDWEPYCIFPVHEGPRIVYYQGRTYTDDGFETTKKFPSKYQVPYGANYWIHGLDDLTNPKIRVVVLVESILNRLSLNLKLREDGHEDTVAVCIFTHFLSRPQVAKLQRYRHITEWCLLFDSDSTALAHKTAIATGCMMKTSVAEMPPGLNPDGTIRKTNDANDDAQTALEMVKQRKQPNPEPVIKGKMPERRSVISYMS